MQRVKTRTRAKRGRWAKYNALRAKNRELVRQRRLARAAERRAEADARLCALAEELAKLPKPKRGPSPLRLRIRIEAVWPGNRESHSFTTRFCPAFGSWSVSQRRILSGISALMRRAPEIASEKSTPTNL